MGGFVSSWIGGKSKARRSWLFGDSENDLEMLELADFSYAMENGDEKIKRIASRLAPANSEAGVLQVIETILRKKESKWQFNY